MPIAFGCFVMTTKLVPPVLSLVACPKSFRNQFARIQRNAITSWSLLRPEAEIVLVGDDFGTSDIAKELGLQHLPHVARNSSGTPLVSSIFELGQSVAAAESVCYVNADIILLSDFLEGVRSAIRDFPDGLLVGRRTEVRIETPIDFTNPDWERDLRSRARRLGYLQQPSAIDYFVFRRGSFLNMPPFAVGRPRWDNWLLYEAKRSGLPLVDITAIATVIHQPHNYTHHPSGQVGVWTGQEAKENAALLGVGRAGYTRVFTIRDADWQLTATGKRRPFLLNRAYRRLVRSAETSLLAAALVWLLRSGKRLAGVFRRRASG
jgi:hypothetical protein